MDRHVRLHKGSHEAGKRSTLPSAIATNDGSRPSTVAQLTHLVQEVLPQPMPRGSTRRREIHSIHLPAGCAATANGAATAPASEVSRKRRRSMAGWWSARGIRSSAPATRSAWSSPSARPPCRPRTRRRSDDRPIDAGVQVAPWSLERRARCPLRTLPTHDYSARLSRRACSDLKGCPIGVRLSWRVVVCGVTNERPSYEEDDHAQLAIHRPTHRRTRSIHNRLCPESRIRHCRRGQGHAGEDGCRDQGRQGQGAGHD